MGHNMGTMDRSLRLILAVAIGVLFVTKIITGIWGMVFIALAVIFVLTGLVRFCPLYFALGLRTQGKKVEHAA